MNTKLHELVYQWERWAETVSQDEDGWQADFPAWQQLIQAAIRAMQRDTFTAESLMDLEWCWAISEEGEDLADFARQHLDACWPALQQLVHSPHASVRWQVYDVLGDAGPRAEPLLRAGLDDPDSYAKRRAILALARLHPTDAGRLATRFADDADPYIRLAASTLSKS